MYRNWKKTAALGLTVLIGCMMPMSTMLAAEDNAGTEVSSVSDNDVFHDDENVPDNGNISDAGDVSDSIDIGESQDDENDENDESGDEGTGGTDGSSEDESVDLENKPTIKKVQARGAQTPEITITWSGKNLICEWGESRDYEYMNYNIKAFRFDVAASHADSLSYYLHKVTDISQGALGKDDLQAVKVWTTISSGEMIQLNNDGTYVLYVKAEGSDGQISYVRSVGIVGDTQAPKVTGVEEGKPCPDGTVFQIEDANLESVTINEQSVELSADGKYQVIANGTSCVIKAKDKAGNETTRSITVLENGTPETGNVISQNGIYQLKAGVKYQLKEGKWKISGDQSVYQGGSDFYVKEDGSYGFFRYFTK